VRSQEPQIEVRGDGSECHRQHRVHLLSAFGLVSSGRRVPLSLSSQRLLAFLSLQSRPLERSYVAARLWPGTSDLGAKACLRSSLWRLKGCCDGVAPVITTRVHLWLAEHVEVDVREQVRLADEIFNGRVDVDDVGYLSLLECELLPDWHDDWVVIERERLRQLRLHALEARAIGLRNVGQYGKATESAFAALRADPLRESTHRILIETYLAEGNRAQALGHYRHYAQLLERRLALEPDPGLQTLIATCAGVGTRMIDGV
jgi:DNA-binding SARP family transcriptional activator